MMSKYLLSFIFFFGFIVSISAQFVKDAYVEDGVYDAYNLANNVNLKIEQLSLGNGTKVFRGTNKKYLDGSYKIMIDGSKYLLVNISKGLLHGDYKFFDGDKLFQKTKYNYGLVDELITVYYDTGEVSSTKEFQDNTLKLFSEYNKQGKLLKKTHYNYKDTRFYEQVYDDEGKLIAENYDHGLRKNKVEYRADGYTEVKEYLHYFVDGKYKLIYPNGQTKSEGYYYKDVPTGNWIHYNEDGTPSEINNTNSSVTYFENGKINTYTEYNQGKSKGKDGKHQEYQEHPYTLLVDANYKNNYLDGVYKSYLDGVIWRDCIYNKGELISEKEYQNGKLKIWKMLDEFGDLVDVQRYDNAGKTIYKNRNFKKNPILLEDKSGIIDLE